MWGIRAIRVGVVLALVVPVGCKSAETPPWGTGDFQSGPPGAKTENEQPDPELKDWKRPWFKDQPQHLTPERVTGGIY